MCDGSICGQNYEKTKVTRLLSLDSFLLTIISSFCKSKQPLKTKSTKAVHAAKVLGLGEDWGLGALAGSRGSTAVSFQGAKPLEILVY